MAKRALISISDKTGIVNFARRLVELGFEVISTGGTAKTLIEAGITVTKVSDVTGFPEILDGRVKTLHPKIHGGILGIRDNEEHKKQMEDMGIAPIDIVVINLYPFKQTVAKPDATQEEIIENIDIGGPAMLRAAAKNHEYVTVVVNPDKYPLVLRELEQNGEVSRETRYALALEVFEHTAAYDAAIANYMCGRVDNAVFPTNLTITFEKVQDLRYGENPHQSAAFYKDICLPVASLAKAEQLQGKELSFNNINDTAAAVELVREFSKATAVAVKHTNPCGVGSALKISEAFRKAYECDPVSIFGGILAFNRTVDAATAAEIAKIFIEVVIAPHYEQEALEILKEKKNLRILKLEDLSLPTVRRGVWDIRSVPGGLLVQEADELNYDREKLKVVTKIKPTQEQWDDMLFGWKVVKHMKSNAIAIVKDEQTVGLGPGQVNRIWPTRYSLKQAGDKAQGAVLASDAFFPFPDVVEAAAEAGVKAIIQPGGSIRDEESIKAANDAGIAMVFTEVRHFKH